MLALIQRRRMLVRDFWTHKMKSLVFGDLIWVLSAAARIIIRRNIQYQCAGFSEARDVVCGVDTVVGSYVCSCLPHVRQLLLPFLLHCCIKYLP